MDEEEKQDGAHDCSSCGGTVTAEDLAKGRAFRREGKVYCRRCIRKEFPGECRNHPGVKTDAKCAMCRSPYCGDCLVEIGGVRVCEKCKPAVLEMLRKGEDIDKPGALAPAMRPWEKVVPGELHEKAIGKKPTLIFYIFLVAVTVATVLILMFAKGKAGETGVLLLWVVGAYGLGICWHVTTRLPVQYVSMDDRGIEAVRGNRKAVKISWDDVLKIAFHGRRIVVTNYVYPIKIYKSLFTRFHLIADTLRQACLAKGIACSGIGCSSRELESDEKQVRDVLGTHLGDYLIAAVLFPGATATWMYCLYSEWLPRTPLALLAGPLFLFALLVVYVVRLNRRKGKLRFIRVDDYGIAGSACGGLRFSIPWNAVSKVTNANMRIVVDTAEGPPLVINSYFKRFDEIVDFIYSKCKDKGIRFDKK